MFFSTFEWQLTRLRLQELSCQVAEPRLALIRFTVLRGGVHVTNWRIKTCHKPFRNGSWLLKVAQTVVPVNRIRPGVRWLQLFDPVSNSDKVQIISVKRTALVLMSELW
jgi:hypothetical protein